MIKDLKRISLVLVVSSFITASFLNSCKKDTPPPHNPYDDVKYGNTGTPKDTVDPTSFLGIHRNILQPKCAVPGCHVGNFEPDFRTVQSSYSTLVYHRIKKNNVDEDFDFRVVPFNTKLSVLYERLTNCCFVNQDDRMPQDNIGSQLPQKDIDNIAAWINNGAKDYAGQLPKYPNTAANVLFFVAASMDFKINYSSDTNRLNDITYNPFIAPKDADMLVVHFVEDDSTAIKDLKVNKLKLSLKQDDFSAPIAEYANTYFNVPNEAEVWLTTINTATLPKDTVIYMRYYVNDGEQGADTEMPRGDLPAPYKTYWSFYNPK